MLGSYSQYRPCAGQQATLSVNSSASTCEQDLSASFSYPTFVAALHIELIAKYTWNRLCMHRDVHALMEVLSREETEFIRKSDCKSMIGSEQYYTLSLMRGKKGEVEVYTNLWSRTPGMVFKITGTNAAIQTAKRQIEYFRRRGQFLSFVRKTFPGLSCLWTEGASLLIFEGSDPVSKVNKVEFKAYFGARHDEHDNTGIYIPMVKLFDPAVEQPRDAHGDEFNAFRKHLLERFQLIKDKKAYNCLCNGPVQLEVKFGRLYMVHAPKSYLESPDGVAVNEIKEMIARAYKKGIIRSPLMWREEVLRRSHTRSTIDPGLQSGFCSRISPTINFDQLKGILKEQGFEESGFEEGYLLTCYGKSTTMVAKYDQNRRLVQTNPPPLKWMVTDVRRNSSTKLSESCDIRFEISSQRYNSISRDDRELHQALNFRNGNTFVNRNMMGKAKEFR